MKWYVDLDSTVLYSPMLRLIKPWCDITKLLSCSILAQGGEVNDTTLTEVCEELFNLIKKISLKVKTQVINL